jgi:phosphohistidine phosphatase
MRELIVMRHAKAEAFASSDHDRELTARGVADATEAGRWAGEHGVVPDHALVSSAARARGTWEAFRDGSGCGCEPVVDAGIYAAGTDAALEILRTAPDDARRLMILGHNPTMASLVHLLDDGGADQALFARVASEYPTAALTVLRVESAWSELEVGGARITGFHVGRG